MPSGSTFDRRSTCEQQNLSVVPLNRNGNTVYSSFAFRIIFLPNHSVQLPLPHRLLIDPKAMSKRRSIEHLSKTYRTSIEHLSKTYRTSIEDLSNDFCFQLTCPSSIRLFIALQNALTKSDTGISFSNFVIIACCFIFGVQNKRLLMP